MAQTPISASANYKSTTPTTLYTVPAGATAIVKTVLGSSLVGSYDSVTVNKVSSGITYPLVQNRQTGYPILSQQYSAYPAVESVNLLAGPVTLAAGDVLSISTATAGKYKFPTTVTAAQFPLYRVNNIVYINSTYIAVGFDSGTGSGLVLTSTDAITWTKQTFPFGITLTDIAYDGSTNYVVVGTGNIGFVYYSTNLTSWTQVAAPNTTDMYCVTYGNGKFVAGGLGGQIWYATTPTSWTGSVTVVATDINSVLTIGTSWAFGSTGAYSYTSDFSTYYAPYYFRPISNASSVGSYSYATDVAGKLYVGNGLANPSGNPTTALYYSTDTGKTFTAYNLSALSSMPTNLVSPFSFGNGGRMAWMNVHPGNSRYLASSDGVTWTSQNFTGTFYNSSSTWWSSASSNLGSTYNGMVSYLTGGQGSSYGAIQTGSVDSSGIYTNLASFVLNSSDNIAPNQYGEGAGAISTSAGTWQLLSLFVGNPSYWGNCGGATLSSGSGTQGAGYLGYAPSNGYPTTLCSTPASTGFIAGSTNGYILTSATYTDYFYASARVMPDNGRITAITAGGTTATSKILAITENGYIAQSTDQGVTWTYITQLIGSFPSRSYIGGNKCLQFNNGVWMAFDSNRGIYYSLDGGFTWNGNPLNIVSMYTLNSNNLFIQNENGLTYTTSTNLDVFVKPTATSFGGFPSIRRMAYVGGIYLIGGGNTIYSSTNLTSWSSNSIASQSLNNITYYTSTASAASAIIYTGSGSNIVVGNALRSIAASSFSIGQPTVLSTSLVTGSATVGLVEIT